MLSGALPQCKSAISSSQKLYRNSYLASCCKSSTLTRKLSLALPLMTESKNAFLCFCMSGLFRSRIEYLLFLSTALELSKFATFGLYLIPVCWWGQCLLFALRCQFTLVEALSISIFGFLTFEKWTKVLEICHYTYTPNLQLLRLNLSLQVRLGRSL